MKLTSEQCTIEGGWVCYDPAGRRCTFQISDAPTAGMQLGKGNDIVRRSRDEVIMAFACWCAHNWTAGSVVYRNGEEIELD